MTKRTQHQGGGSVDKRKQQVIVVVGEARLGLGLDELAIVVARLRVA